MIPLSRDPFKPLKYKGIYIFSAQFTLLKILILYGKYFICLYTHTNFLYYYYFFYFILHNFFFKLFYTPLSTFLQFPNLKPLTTFLKLLWCSLSFCSSTAHIFFYGKKEFIGIWNCMRMSK